MVAAADPVHAAHLGPARRPEAAADGGRDLGVECEAHMELLEEGRLLLATLDRDTRTYTFSS